MALQDTIDDIIRRLRGGVKTAGKNIASWKQIATTPSLRQEYGKYVAKPLLKPKTGYLATSGRLAARRIGSIPISPKVADIPMSFGRGMVRGAGGFTGAEKVFKSPYLKYKPITKTGQAMEFGGSMLGFALGPGKALMPLESAVAGRLGLGSVSKTAPWLKRKLTGATSKLISATGAEAASSAVLTPIEAYMKKRPVGEAFKEQLAGGMAGRGIGGALGRGLALGGLMMGGTKALKKPILSAVKKHTANIEVLSKLHRYFKNLSPKEQMEVFEKATKIEKEVLPDIAKTREMKYLRTANPDEWLNTVVKFADDRLVASRHPDFLMGYGTRELKKPKVKKLRE